jgi:DNA-binding CsgD family transcriptional regulator
MDQVPHPSHLSLTALGNLISWLQAQAKLVPAEQFRALALDRLRAHVPFARAMWGDAGITHRMTVLNPQLYGFVADEVTPFEDGVFAEPRLMHVLHDPGHAIAYPIVADSHEALRALGKRQNIGTVLTVAQFEPNLGIATGQVFTRTRSDPVWTEGERQFVEAAFPHFVQAWLDCQVATLLRETPGHHGMPVNAAACQGAYFKVIDTEAARLIRKEWPAWTGSAVPGQLFEWLARPENRRFLGKLIVITAHRQADITLFIVRDRCPADGLTARESQVANLSVSGLSYREIAARLNVSPVTAKNHIASIHRRLGVSKNSEIAVKLAMAD